MPHHALQTHWLIFVRLQLVRQQLATSVYAASKVKTCPSLDGSFSKQSQQSRKTRIMMAGPHSDTRATDTQLLSHTLPNGLQVLGQQMPDLESISVCFY